MNLRPGSRFLFFCLVCGGGSHRRPPCLFGFIFFTGTLPEQEEVVVFIWGQLGTIILLHDEK